MIGKIPYIFLFYAKGIKAWGFVWQQVWYCYEKVFMSFHCFLCFQNSSHKDFCSIQIQTFKGEAYGFVSKLCTSYIITKIIIKNCSL